MQLFLAASCRLLTVWLEFILLTSTALALNPYVESFAANLENPPHGLHWFPTTLRHLLLADASQRSLTTSRQSLGFCRFPYVPSQPQPNLSGSGVRAY